MCICVHTFRTQESEKNIDVIIPMSLCPTLHAIYSIP